MEDGAPRGRHRGRSPSRAEQLTGDDGDGVRVPAGADGGL